MATKAERFHSDEERRHKKTAAKPSSPKRTKREKRKEHTAKKASYALEPKRAGRPSRKSSRKSANRQKPDSSLNLHEEMVKGSPEARHDKKKGGARIRGR